MPYPNRRAKKICETCGKEFEFPKSQLKHNNRRFCSEECFYIWLEIYERAEYVDVTCQSCGKPLHILKSRYNDGRGRFCSQKCMMKERPPSVPKKPRIECKCWHCGAVFYKLPCQITKKGDGRFCSRGCSAAYYSVRNYTKRTQIEKLLMGELDRRGIDYCPQYAIRGWAIDIAFPEQKLAVEADGIYWHSLKNVQEKDRRKDHDLQDRGWYVLRFGEEEINQDVSRCVDVIQSHLQTSQ